VKRVVLDASAVMTYFVGRPGAERVKALLAEAAEGQKTLLMSVVNWGEVYYSVWRTKGRDAAQHALHILAQLPIELVPADAELTRLAAELRAGHKLPYADCFAAALARLRKAALLTSDGDFAAVQDEVPILWCAE
jgi:predicted nucleic acid-binding protein